MWTVMCVCRNVCHTQARSCLSMGRALNCCFAWGFGTAVRCSKARGMDWATVSLQCESRALRSSTCLTSGLFQVLRGWGSGLELQQRRHSAVLLLGPDPPPCFWTRIPRLSDALTNGQLTPRVGAVVTMPHALLFSNAAVAHLTILLQVGFCRPHPPPPAPPLLKLRPCPRYSGRRDRTNLEPNLIRYQM